MIKIAEWGMWLWLMSVLVGAVILSLTEAVWLVGEGFNAKFLDLSPLTILSLFLVTLSLRQVMTNRWLRSMIVFCIIAVAANPTYSIVIEDISPINSHLYSLSYALIPAVALLLLDMFAGGRNVMRDVKSSSEEVGDDVDDTSLKPEVRSQSESWEEIEIVETGSGRLLGGRNSRWRPKRASRLSFAGK